MSLRNCSKVSFIVFIIALLSLAMFVGCSSKRNSKSGADTDGTGGDIDPSAFRFEPATASANPGDTVHFGLVNGTPPYQFGYVSAGDIQSYSDPSMVQATFESNTGLGSYVVGANNDCTDKLAAQDSMGEICYLTITVGAGGSGGDTDGVVLVPGPGAGGLNPQWPIDGPYPTGPWNDPQGAYYFINCMRGRYDKPGGLSHSRYKGIHPNGESHNTYTWSTHFLWKDELAASAQARAETAAASGYFTGQQICYNGKSFYISGYGTNHYVISGIEKPNDWENNVFPLSNSCGGMRMMFYYHDYGGDGPALSRIGIGMAQAGNNKYWVIIVGD